MKILFICAIFYATYVKSQSEEEHACYEVTMQNEVKEEMGWFWATLACNLMLLGLNITITIVIYKFINPAYKNIRLVLFFLMDRILLSYMANCLRPILGCKKQVDLKELLPAAKEKEKRKSGKSGKAGDEESGKSTIKGLSTKKGAITSKASKTSLKSSAKSTAKSDVSQSKSTSKHGKGGKKGGKGGKAAPARKGKGKGGKKGGK
ncbi:unnamed protein product [Caenorhabditis angaria]|uniref:Serpentine receptor class gamma n=1 Tax=Caenorhabditis angaria TaxID=860376 RepID=A0A9P1IGE8_9PELO|nr:unnamed protein product [Caenorhabditis angaria]